MPEHDVFDRRLAAALLGYATDAPTDVDAVNLARAIALDHPRHRPSWNVVLRTGRRSRLTWVVAAALIVLASLRAVASIGAWLKDRDDFVVGPTSPTPAELVGEWRTAATTETEPVEELGVYHLDFRAANLLRDPGGADMSWAGRCGRRQLSRPRAAEATLNRGLAQGSSRHVPCTSRRP
jgi:hypothetical protein